MDNREFNRFMNSLPTRSQVVGTLADGTPLTIQVPTIFGADEPEIEVTA